MCGARYEGHIVHRGKQAEDTNALPPPSGYNRKHTLAVSIKREALYWFVFLITKQRLTEQLNIKVEDQTG